MKKCPKTCPCLCHEGCGPIEHTPGKNCYGKWGGQSEWGPSWADLTESASRSRR